MTKDLLTGFDVTKDEIQQLFLQARQLKQKKVQPLLAGKNVVLVFEKPSMRTRVSFELGMRQLGAGCIYLAPQDIRLGEREPVKDIARVMARYADAIVARTFSHAHVEELARYASISVINGLSDRYHPCQALGDVFTIWEHGGTCKGITLAYVGDGNNVVHSLLAVGAAMGMELRIATPKGYEPDKGIWQQAEALCRKSGGKITHTNRPQEAVKAADVLYTDVWTSMGQEAEQERRLKAFRGFQLDMRLVNHAAKGARVMHCMPMHRGEEISDEAAESDQSIIFDQAETRMHIQKAIMVRLLKKRG